MFGFPARSSATSAAIFTVTGPAAVGVTSNVLDLPRGERHVVVEVEVVAQRRHPEKAPAHALLVGLELLEGRARYSDDRHAAMVEVDDGRVPVVGPEGAARTALLPLRSVHEVLHDELAAAVEQAG